jgi:hypothetical protein
LLREAWQAYQDQRIRQLVINQAEKGHDCAPDYSFDEL